MQHHHIRPSLLLPVALLLLSVSPLPAEEPSSAATAFFDRYVAALETRLGQQHASAATFVAGGLAAAPPLSQPPAPVVQRLTPPGGYLLPGALLHHWRGSVFIAGATAASFEDLLRDLGRYPAVFAPEVLQSRLIAGTGDQLQGVMRVQQHHVLTVVLDDRYNLSFGQLDPQRVFVATRSSHITEVAHPGIAAERPLGSADDHGFLWRLNSYWTCEQQEGGLYVQLESVTLTRSVPAGLGWAVGPFLESIPRESLAFTLRSVAHGLQR